MTDGFVAISTPFIDNEYDNINLYVSFVNEDTVEVSDFGDTLFNLEEFGINPTPRFKTGWKVFEATLTDFGVNNGDGILKIKVPLDYFPVAKTRLLQAIMRINDIVYLNKSNMLESFNAMLTKFFSKNEILFTPSFEISIPSGASAHFDFSIPNSTKKERIIKTASRPC